MIQRKKKKLNQLADVLVKYILSDKCLNAKYASDIRTRKYNIRQYIDIIIKVLWSGMPWREVNQYKITGDISWNAVYKTYIKLITDNVISKCFTDVVAKRINRKSIQKVHIYMTDTSSVSNKLGQEKVGRNKYYKNKNISKISIIANNKGMPLDVDIYAGNRYDSAIFQEQLNNQNSMRNNSILLADKGYDSSIIRNKLMQKGIHPIIPYNKRNTKNIDKIKHMTNKEKRIYKKRILIEQTFMRLKRYRRINVRYDRKYESYKGFVLMASLDLVLKST